MLTIILLVVFFACVAMLVREGIWSNTITLLNVIVAALLATNYFEPLANWLDKMEPSYTYLWDFVAIWAVFCGSMIVLRGVSDKLSKVRVRFKGPIDLAGGLILALWIAWVMVGFTTMTLHMAPLSENFLGFYKTPASTTFLGMAPDRQWLGFAQSLSGGSLATSGSGEEGMNVFDPNSEYIFKYRERRAQFSKQIEMRVRKK